MNEGRREGWGEKKKIKFLFIVAFVFVIFQRVFFFSFVLTVSIVNFEKNKKRFFFLFKLKSNERFNAVSSSKKKQHEQKGTD